MSLTEVATDLTSRQIDVLTLIKEGCAGKEIASMLGINHGTVKTHISDILCRLNARNSTHAVIIAIRCGYITARKGSDIGRYSAHTIR